ncbi:MAG: Uma2 family endonuclease [Rhodomicrobium sp.]
MTHFESRDERLSFATRAAEGLPRRRFTVAEIEAMVAAGILDEDEHIELIGGEVVPMAAKGNRHEVVKIALNRYCSKRISDDFILAQETTFRLSADTFLEPDFIFFGMQTKLKELSAGNVHLAVEVADTSFSYDIGRKAALYASFGIAELWVIHAVRLETRIHRMPSLTGYQDLIDLASDQALVPAFAPELAVTLCELELN